MMAPARKRRLRLVPPAASRPHPRRLWMLDTDISSYIIRRHPPEVRARLKRAGLGTVCISTVTLAELYYGAACNRPYSDRLRREIDDFACRLRVLPWDERVADHYGQVRAYLDTKGTPIGAMDMMIAAHARSAGMALVTNNREHFRRVPGLKIENWAAPSRVK